MKNIKIKKYLSYIYLNPCYFDRKLFNGEKNEKKPIQQFRWFLVCCNNKYSEKAIRGDIMPRSAVYWLLIVRWRRNCRVSRAFFVASLPIAVLQNCRLKLYRL